ncbi:MAG: polysaccharide pyruvyl transferase family protein [Cyanophyceae cyanobacterium]
MKLYYFQYSSKRFPGGLNNFGDQLNPWLWERLIPDVLDDDASTAFVGIGTLLNHLLPQRVPQARQLAIFSTGLGYEQLPKLDQSWKIYCVRGPLTTRKLGVSEELAITDGAALVRRLFTPTAPKIHQYAFMPHAKSARTAESPQGVGERGTGNGERDTSRPVLTWENICQQAGIGYIDPRWAVEDVLTAISQTEVLLTEAMHGAIVADALRIPWIPVVTNTNILAFKWRDWCRSLGLEYRPHLILPWSLYSPPRGVRSAMRSGGYCFTWLMQDRLRSMLSGLNQPLIAAQLKRIARSRPQLSSTARLEQVTVGLETKLEELRRDVAAGYFDSSQ